MVNVSKPRIGLRLLYNPSWLGGVNYVLSIGRMLKSLPPNERPEIIFLTAGEEAESIALMHREIADQIEPIESTPNLNLDFVYPATQLAESSFGAPWAGWVPDWQCQHFPELFPDRERVRRFIQYRELVTGPAGCVFSSQQAIEDTKSLFGKRHDNADWYVFHFPAVFDDHIWDINEVSIAETRKKFQVPDRYLIVCNQFWRHKNHLVILEALKSIPDTDIHIVLTGEMKDTRWPDYVDELKTALDDPKVQRRVTLTGRIEREEQLKLLLGASGYLQPSLFEGWSTFVEEARALGLKGLLSDIPVHREQSPEGAMFFNASQANDLALKLKEFLNDMPSRTDRTVAREAHNAYVLGSARTFMSVARDVRENYDYTRHDATTVMLKASERVSRETSEYETQMQSDSAKTSISKIGPTREDYDRFFGGLRHLLRRFPEDLARLSLMIASSSNVEKKKLEVQLVQATLRKMDEPLRARFHQCHEQTEQSPLNPSQYDAVNLSKQRHGSFVSKRLVLLSRFIDRAINYARRKIT